MVEKVNWDDLKDPEYYDGEIAKLEAQIVELKNLAYKASNKKKLAELGELSEEDNAVFFMWTSKGFDSELALAQVELARKERKNKDTPQGDKSSHRRRYGCGC